MIGKTFKDRRELKKLAWCMKKLDRKMLSLIWKNRLEEREHLLKYMIISKLKEKVIDLEKLFFDRTSSLKEINSGIHYLEHKILTIPSKIKHFEVDFEKQEFKKICSLIENIEKEIENV